MNLPANYPEIVARYEKAKKLLDNKSFMKWLEKNEWEQYDGWDRWINQRKGNTVRGISILYKYYLRNRIISSR